MPMLEGLPRIAAVVVNWNRKSDTLRCLASLAASDLPLETILVDNDSSDGSVEAVLAAFPAVRVMRNPHNLGFAEGNNVALREIQRQGYDFVLLLNNDATVAADSLRLLLEPMLNDPAIGITGPSIRYLDDPERVWSAGGTISPADWSVLSERYNQPASALPVDPYAVDHVSGCCMLVRLAAIDAAGLLDARFFMYYEETEWCVRIARHGYRIMVVPQASAWHAISPLAQEGSRAVAYYMARNQLLFLRAVGAPRGVRTRVVARQLRTLASLFIDPHTPGRARGRRPMLWALRDYALGKFGPLEVPR